MIKEFLESNYEFVEYPEKNVSVLSEYYPPSKQADDYYMSIRMYLDNESVFELRMYKNKTELHEYRYTFWTTRIMVGFGIEGYVALQKKDNEFSFEGYSNDNQIENDVYRYTNPDETSVTGMSMYENNSDSTKNMEFDIRGKIWEI